MKVTRRAIIFLCVFGIALGLFRSNISTTLACSCFPPPPTDVALKYSDAVFMGKVVKVEYLDDPKQRNPEARFIVTFDVIRSWKGVSTREFVLHTIDNSWTCNGYYFRQDKEYLVFAYKNGAEDTKRFEPHELPKKSFGVSLCGRTKLLSNAKSDLDVLGEGSVPKLGVMIPPPSNTPLDRSGGSAFLKQLISCNIPLVAPPGQL